MRPIIIHHLNELCLGGTEKMLQIMMKYFVKEGTYNHVLAYRAQGRRDREEYFREIMGENKLIAYASYPEFVAIVGKLKPFCIHRYSAGIPEFPFVAPVKVHTKHFVSTSVFGNQDDTIDISKVIFVSKHIQHLAQRFDPKYIVVRNAIEAPYTDEVLFPELKDKFVFGHIGRPDANTYSDTNLRAYKKIENENTMFLWLPQNPMVNNSIKELGIKNIDMIPATTDETFLSKFYNTIDVLAHSRKDGECNPAVMWEAMAHGKPIVSHYGLPFNGHVEVIKNCGFCVAPEDVNEYARIMERFIDGTINYYNLSRNALDNWKNTCQAEDIANQQLDIYKKL